MSGSRARLGSHPPVVSGSRWSRPGGATSAWWWPGRGAGPGRAGRGSDGELGEDVVQVVLDRARLMNSRVSTSGLERPSRASRAIRPLGQPSPEQVHQPGRSYVTSQTAMPKVAGVPTRPTTITVAPGPLLVRGDLVLSTPREHGCAAAAAPGPSRSATAPAASTSTAPPVPGTQASASRRAPKPEYRSWPMSRVPASTRPLS